MIEASDVLLCCCAAVLLAAERSAEVHGLYKHTLRKVSNRELSEEVSATIAILFRKCHRSPTTDGAGRGLQEMEAVVQ